MQYILYGYLSVSVLAFVIVLIVNIKFLIEFLSTHVDAAEIEFGCLNGLEVTIYVLLHSIATIITFVIHCALRAIQWPKILHQSLLTKISTPARRARK